MFWYIIKGHARSPRAAVSLFTNKAASVGMKTILLPVLLNDVCYQSMFCIIFSKWGISMVLQHDTLIPLHQQLSDMLRWDIQTGKYAPGQKIPTELELSEYYQVSRVTVRSALESLVKRGLLERKRGKGTFVAQSRMSRSIVNDISFTDMCLQSGMTPGARTIKSVIETANDEDIQELELVPPARVMVLERIRYANNVPVSIEIHRMPERYLFLLEEDLNNASLQKAIAAKNYVWHGYGKTIKLVYAAYEEAKYLSVSRGYPLISIQSLSYDDQGPAHRVTQLIVGDRLELRTV